MVPALLLAVTVLGACGSGGGLLGSAKETPDEFAVVSHSPLVIPPDYTLRPPRPGAPRPQEQAVRDAAADEVFGRTGDQSGSRTPGEEAILARADALNPDPNIREEIERQFSVYAHEEEGFFESLLFWQDDEADGVTIDASAEAERLRENAALGRAPDEGATPIIEKQDKALLEDLF